MTDVFLRHGSILLTPALFFLLYFIFPKDTTAQYLEPRQVPAGRVAYGSGGGHQKGVVPESSGTVQLSQTRGPQSCHVCGRQCRSKSALDIHFRIHTGEKPYICEICGKTFAIKGNKRSHMASHVNLKT